MLEDYFHPDDITSGWNVRKPPKMVKLVLHFSSKKTCFCCMCVFPEEKGVFPRLIDLPYVCRRILEWILPPLNRGKVTRE